MFVKDFSKVEQNTKINISMKAQGFSVEKRKIEEAEN